MKLIKRILGSLCSVIAGWLACTAAWVTIVAIQGLAEDPARSLSSALGFGIYVAAICGIFTMATWLLAFVWIYLFLPASSPLWVWWRAMLAGAAAGIVIIAALTTIISRDGAISVLLFFGSSAALTGGVAAAFAALTRRAFHDAPGP